MDSMFQLLAKLFTEILVVVVLLGCFEKKKHLEANLHKVLLDHAQDFVLMQSREMFRGRSSESTAPLAKLNHSGINSSQTSMLKKATHVQLDVVAFLLRFTRTNQCTKVCEQPRAEPTFALNCEMLHCQTVLQIVSQ